MVVQKTIDNLKDKPKDERKAVAGGIAIAVIAVLLVGWAFLFIKKIQSGTQELNFDSGAQSEFNSSSVKAAQQAIQAQNSAASADDLYQLRNDAAANQVQGTQQVQVQQTGSSQDPFGNSGAY